MTGWDDVAATALLGTARRTLPANAVPAALAPLAGAGTGAGADPSAALLDVAALGAVYRRAGMRLQPPRQLPDPAPADGRGLVPHDARVRLRELIALHDADLLGQWLRVATQRRLAPPPASVPALLNVVRERNQVPDVAAAVGPRGIWLAAFQPHWRRRVGLVDADVPTWADSSREERRQLLTDLGASTAVKARDLVGTGWSDLATIPDPGLTTVLRQAVSGNDEDFLEECLDDRRAKVRIAAAGLLSLLPGSAFTARAIDRAGRTVGVEGRLRRRVVVRPPAGFDAAMQRDQLPAPPEGTATAGWLVMQIVRAAPLHVWPEGVAELPIEDRWSSTLWHGWLEAAAWEQNLPWATMLIPREPRTGPGGRAPFVAKLLSAFPAPWPRELSLAVLDWLQARGRSRDDQSRGVQYPHDINRVLELAARRLPVEAVEALDAAGRRWPPGSAARYAFTQAASVMIYRRTMFEELQ